MIVFDRVHVIMSSRRLIQASKQHICLDISSYKRDISCHILSKIRLPLSHQWSIKYRHHEGHMHRWKGLHVWATWASKRCSIIGATLVGKRCSITGATPTGERHSTNGEIQASSTNGNTRGVGLTGGAASTIWVDDDNDDDTNGEKRCGHIGPK